IGVAESWVVGREDVEAVGERRDQIAELVRRGGKAAEQQQLRVRRIPGLAVEDRDSLDLCCAVCDHCGSFPSVVFVSGGLRPDASGPYARKNVPADDAQSA